MASVKRPSEAKLQQPPVTTVRASVTTGVAQMPSGERRTSRLSSVLHAITRFIEKHSPGKARTNLQIRTALKSGRQETRATIQLAAQSTQKAVKSAQPHLNRLISALVAGNSSAAPQAAADATRALSSVATSTTGQAADIAKLGGESLLRQLSSLSDKDFAKLDATLKKLSSSSSDPTIKQLDISVKSELLHRELGKLGLQGEKWDTRRVTVFAIPLNQLVKLKPLHDFASALPGSTASGPAAQPKLLGARQTASELQEIQKYGSDVVLELQQRVSRLTTSDAMAQMTGVELKDLKAAVDALLHTKGNSLVPVDGKLLSAQQTAVDNQIKVHDGHIALKMLGATPFNASALDDAKLAGLARDIAQLDHKPLLVADAEKAIHTQIEQRKEMAEKAFKTSLQAAVRGASGTNAEGAMVRHVKEAQAATGLFKALKEPLSTDKISRWIGAVIDDERALGRVGDAAVEKLKGKLTVGNGQLDKSWLPADTSSEYLLVLKNVLNAKS